MGVQVMKLAQLCCVIVFLFGCLGLVGYAGAEEPQSRSITGQQNESAEQSEHGILVLPETVVTADRLETPVQEVGRSVDVRTEEEFNQREIQTLTSAVQDVSGVRMTDIGGPGSPGVTPLEVRGFSTRGTQLMLNGLKLNDPTSVSGTFESFLPFVTVHDISRVEVMKGGAGVLYGSDSLSGVVNMLTEMPEPGSRARASFEAGSFNTYTEDALFNVGNSRGGAVGSVFRTDSNGLDAHGDYDNTTLSAVGRYDLVPEKLSVSPIFRLIDAHVDLDKSPTVDENGRLVPNQDSPTDNLDARSYLLGMSATHTPTERVETVADVYFLDNDRHYLYDFGGFPSRSGFDGSSLNADMHSTYNAKELNSRVSVGLSLEHQEADTNADDLDTSEQRDQTALFIYDRTLLFDERLSLAGGARVAQVSDIDKTVTTLEASGSYKVPAVDSRLHTSVAQGYRAPTLFQSRGTMVDFNTGQVVTVGNRNLDVEDSLSFDAGVEQPLWGDRLIADVTYFETDADKTIIFDFPNMTHVNGEDGKFRGIESSLLVRPIDWFYLRAAYTNVDEADQGDGLRRPRSPRNWYALTGVFEVERFTLSSEVRYRDSQELDFFGMPERVKEGGVTVCNMSATYRLDKQLSLFVRGENVFDTEYTEGGYRMPRAAVFGGIRVDLGV
jgi:vitamin B12 transporter